MVAAAIIGSAAIGAVVSSSASKDAANTQANAANNAANLTKDQYQQTRSDLQPFVQGGYGAQTSLNNYLGVGTPTDGSTYGQLTRQFTPADYLANRDPGYGFQLQQGQQALQNSQAAQDGVLSGAALKGLIGFNQGMASTGYNDAFNRWNTQNTNTYNRLAGLLQVGENAGAQTGMIGANLAGTTSNAIMSEGNALAAGTIGQANAISGGLNTAASGYMLNSVLNRPGTATIGGGATTGGVNGWAGGDTFTGQA